MAERFYLTTPIYYVNAEPHIGHAYTTIMSDIIVRHHRQRGEDVFFLTGTDEHSSNVVRLAAEAGRTPREHADLNAERFRALGGVVEATNDFFIRTSDPEHVAAVGRVMERLRESGDVYRGTYAGWYCSSCERFYAEDELDEGRLCPIHRRPVEWLEEENWFFRLSAYRDRLLAHYDAHPDWVLPAARRNEARRMIEDGLEDLSISRAGVEWGVPVPWDPDQTVYVWVDALFNYYTALEYARPGEDLVARFWPPDLHVMAKDILKFHAVIWPALLMAAGLELPRREMIHGYVLKGGEKMSKTTGNVVDPFPFIAEYGIDALRYYLAREIRFGEDGTFTAEGFEARYSQELANELGNLLNRVVSMIGRYRGGTVPADPGGDGEIAARGRRRRRGDGRRLRPARHLAGHRGRLAPGAAAQPPGRAARAVDARQGPGARRRARPDALQPRRGPARRRDPAVAGHPRVVRAHPRRARPGPVGDRARARRLGRRAPGRPGPARGPALPPRRGEGRVVDTHAHLDSCDAPPAELVSEAAAAGVERIVTIGVGRESSERAVALCEAHPEVRAAVGVHPHDADGFTPADEAWIRELAAHPAVVAIGECGLDFHRNHSRPEAQRRAFSAQIALARETGLPLVIHTRDAADETLAILADEAAGHPVVMHCFSMPERLDEVAERGYLVSFAGQVTYSSAADLRAGRRRGARRPAAARDRQPLPRAGAAPRPPQPAGQRGPHPPRRRGPARRLRGGPRRAHHPQRRPRLRLVTPARRAAATGWAPCACWPPTACAPTPTWASTSSSTRTSPTSRCARPPSGRATSRSRSAPAWGC